MLHQRYHTRLLLTLSFFLIVYSNTCSSQGKENIPIPSANAKNVRVIKEYADGKGNLVRTIQYEEGKNKVTQTVYLPIHPPTIKRIPIDPDTLIGDSLLIVVNKSKYNLELYYMKHLIRSYKAVFGPKPLNDKLMEGDRCTPEGWFKIAAKSAGHRYDKFLLLDYPNDSSVAKFNRRKRLKAIPDNAMMGSNIGIHGTWKGGDDVITLGVGWTDGCIAIKNDDIDDLYRIVGTGTRVYVRK